MKISVIICTRNRSQDIALALPALLQNTDDDYEVIVVDQSDDDITGAIVCPFVEQNPRLRYLPTDTRGLSRARNLGVQQAAGEIIAFTDDDCHPGGQWVSEIRAIFMTEPDVDMVYGQVLVPPDSPPHAAVPCLYFQQRRVLRCGEILGMGANMAFRRRVFDRVQGYDIALGGGAVLPGAEDFDFSYRVQRAGGRVLVEPSLTLIHRTWREPDVWDRISYVCAIGDAAFYAKHARCGDPWAWGELFKRLTRIAARTALQTIRRKPTSASYLRGFWHGIWKSRSYAIDKQTRLYTEAAGSPSLTPVRLT